MRLIDADALLEAYDREHVGPPGRARKLIEEAPSVADAVALLKEQEPVSVKCIVKWALDDDSNGEPVHSNDRFYDCPRCGQRLSRTYPDKYVKFCWNCGQAVKWDDNGRTA